ncbi:FimV/HubP family polar landmark protein [Thioalkalivibrio thiocyanodenitrificans]|uniref:FimV/HubP family polar landmark protein n=1 Tax=Thioalkalivibrio thiocyanodenitrificans TaxID=243063 RepID=UPI00037C88F3|nr:FimV/HubP family polar landmark protein [Thioalkalivibrio thiocyanodenitrificans]
MRRLVMGMALLGLFLVPGLSQALGLGDIEVRSALNQPLDAEIELVSVRSGEMEDLQVRLAPEALYRRLGIERSGLVTRLSFRPETLPDGRHVIRVTTRDPVREPFVNFLIEASWPAGRLVREYTLLLDPPVMFDAREEPARAPAPEARPAEPRPDPAPRAEAPRREVPGSYTVQSGDTLWNVARNLRPDADVSMEQMMLALLRANPEAFADGNINNLLSGFVLRVPDRAEIDRLDRAEASREVARQNSLWQEYRARVAEETRPQVPAPPAPAEPAVADAQPDDPAEADDARLEILAAREGGGPVAELQQELDLARETAEARTREAEELRSRVAELEALLERSERFLELTNEQMAELQARLDSGEGRDPAAPQEPAEADVADEVPATVDGEAEPMAAEPVPEEPAAPVVDEPAAEPRAATPPAPAEPARPASMIDDLMGHPNALMIVGLLALLVLALAWLMVRRMRRSGAEDSSLALATPAGTGMDMGAGALAGAAAGGAAAGILAGDRSEASDAERLEIEESPGAAVADEAPESRVGEELEAADAEAKSTAAVSEEHEEIINDDTIAEVDVYLAYGLYSQAEDLLKQAIEEHPDRVDYRFKLAETHFATRNTEAFEANAQQMQEVLAGQPSKLWDRVQSMGKDLNPDNPLFTGAAAMAGTGGGHGADEEDLDAAFGDLEGSLDDLEQAAEQDLVEEAEEPRAEGAPQAPGTRPAEAGDDELEFDLGELELDADRLDVDLHDAGAALTEDTGEEDAPAPTLSDPSEDDTRVAELPELDVPVEPEGDLDDTVMEDFSGRTAGSLHDDATEIMEEDFSDMDFLEDGTGEGDASFVSDDEPVEQLADDDEVSTKLDLARAYIDMGDPEGARSTLEEVLSEGNDEQKREAKSLLDQIA